MSKVVKPGVPNKLLDVFWSLAEGTEDVRIKSSHEIINILQDLQGKSPKPCKALQYTVQRLVKGLASTRKWARLGYSLALAQVLRGFSQVEIEEVLTVASQELQISKKDAKSDRSNVLLGKIMVYIAIVRSSRLNEANEDVTGEIIKSLLEIRVQKKPLHLIATQTLVDIITQASKHDFETSVWPHLKKTLSKGWEKCDPDILLLLISSMKNKKIVGEEFLLEHWGGTPLINRDNADCIADVMMASTVDHPILHGVCMALTDLAGKKAKTLKLFWNDIVVGKLLDGNPHRKYICMKLVPVALKHASTEEMVRTVMCKPVLNVMFKSLDKDAVLQGCAKQLSEDLADFVSHCSDSKIQMAVIMAMLDLPCSYKFDIITGTKTVANILHQLNIEALDEFIPVLKGVILGKDVLSDNKDLEDRAVEAKKKWAAYMLTSALSNKNVEADSDLYLSVLKFMFLHSNFQLNKVDKALPECDQVPEDISVGVRKSLQEGFFKSLTKLSTVRNAKSKKLQAFIDVLYDIVQYSRNLFQSKSTKELTKGANIPDLIDQIVGKVDKMRKEKTSADRVNQSTAFQLLFLQLSVHLFVDSSQAEAALQDLTICYEKASLKNRRASMKKNVGEPDWVEVVVELLLSLLSLDSRLNRVIATKVFTFLRPHLTPGAINLIMQVFRSGPGGDNQLDFEDEDEDEGDMDEGETSEVHSNGHNDKDGDEEEEESEEDSDEEEEEEEEEGVEVNEELRKAVKDALGKAAVNSDDEEDDVEMDDDAMLKLDDAISAAFKGMSSKNAKKIEKEKATQMKNFRMRCLDLITALVTEHTPPSLLLLVCQPLLELLDSATRDKDGKQEEKRLQNVLNKLTKMKNFPPDPALKVEELPSMVQNLISYSMKVSGIPMVINVASTCLFVMRFILRNEAKGTTSPVKTRAMRSGGPSKSGSDKQTPQDELMEILENSLTDFCMKRETRLSHMLFHTMFERQATLLWPLTGKLLDLILSDEIRVFCRTRTASMLSAMINKSTAQNLEEETWWEFSSTLVKRVTQRLLEQEDSETKPHYIYELLVLLHRTVTSDKGNVLDLVPDEFVPFLLRVHESIKKNKDLLTVCSQLHSRICTHKGIANELKHQNKGKKDSQKDTRNKDGHSSKKAKKRKMSENGDDAKTKEEVTTKVQKKKKKNKSSKVKKDSLQIHSGGLDSAMDS